MKKIIASAVLGLSVFAFSSGFAADNSVTVGGGGLSGQFIKMAGQSCKALGPLFSCSASESGGSVDNAEKLVSGVFDFAVISGAVEADLRANNPEYAAATEVVRYVGYEAIFAYGEADVMNKGFVNWEGVKANSFAANFALPGEKSGDFKTYEALANNTDLSDAMYSHYGTRDAQISAVKTGLANIGFAVQMGNPDNDFFKKLADSKLTIMPVIDTDLAIQSDLYKVQMVPVSSTLWGMGNNEIETMTVDIAFVAKKASAYTDPKRQKLQEALIKRFKKVDDSKMLPDEGFFKKMIGNKLAKSVSDLQKMGEEMKEKAKAAVADKMK